MAALVLVFPVTFYVSHQLTAEDVSRPKEDQSYLERAQKMDEKFLDQFNYFLAEGKNLSYVIERQEQAQKVMARSNDPSYRIGLALELLNQSFSAESPETEILNAAIAAIGCKYMFDLEKFIVRYMESVSKRSENIERLEKILKSAEEEYGNLVRTAKNKEQLESLWSSFKATHTPGIDKHCLQPYPDASKLLKLFDTALFFASECRAPYRKAYWTEGDCETVIAWSYLFVVCIVFGALFYLDNSPLRGQLRSRSILSSIIMLVDRYPFLASPEYFPKLRTMHMLSRDSFTECVDEIMKDLKEHRDERREKSCSSFDGILSARLIFTSFLVSLLVVASIGLSLYIVDIRNEKAGLQNFHDKMADRVLRANWIEEAEKQHADLLSFTLAKEEQLFKEVACQSRKVDWITILIYGGVIVGIYIVIHFLFFAFARVLEQKDWFIAVTWYRNNFERLNELTHDSMSIILC
ncbi:hypothetical protein QR680_003636 [Steinernema hermaphroditum]|uniref:Dendritic cell-specific transmembrane protein-like domain-containing protein n=1 Tax=Steinernema hermaphroditum TaxID=289476 RepID=A0AA39LSN7_9BILA|nr:hypothetical protein QR680_003636 [Steinernema hermaphroditum]